MVEGNTPSLVTRTAGSGGVFDDGRCSPPGAINYAVHGHEMQFYDDGLYSWIVPALTPPLSASFGHGQGHPTDQIRDIRLNRWALMARFNIWGRPDLRRWPLDVYRLEVDVGHPTYRDAAETLPYRPRAQRIHRTAGRVVSALHRT